MHPTDTRPDFHRQPVYIAGPLAAGTLAERQEHYRRIVALTRYAIRQGFAPVCPHLTIGVPLGWPEVGESPEARVVGLEASMALLDAVVSSDGVVWALRRDDGSLSAGTEAEVEWASGAASLVSGTWAEWCAVGVE